VTSPPITAELVLALPPAWRAALLPAGRNKRPIAEDWPNLPEQPIDALIQAPALALRLGEISSTMTLDFDTKPGRPDPERTFEDVFGRPSSDLPRTIGWTSGLVGRRQIGLRVPPNRWGDMDQSRRRVHQLEVRWGQGMQSIIAGHHPETGAYRWLDGCAPGEVELADAPDWLLDNLPRRASPAPAQPITASPFLGGITVPLLDFVSRATKTLLTTGSLPGHCNDDGLALTLDLVATEAWLIAQGVTPQPSAVDLYAAYIALCPAQINKKPFDTRAAWRRFNGAHERTEHPSTPETTLARRLARHAGRAAQSASQSVAPPLNPPRPQPEAQAEPAAAEDPEQQPEPSPPEAEASPPQAGPLTPERCSARLRQAVAHGIAPADLALLIEQLATDSGLSITTLRQVAASHQATEELQLQTAAAIRALANATARREVEARVTLDYLFPPDIARALQIRHRWLPYDDRSIAVPFLTGVSGLLKLGTRVCGNPASNFSVPVNLYAATVAESGRKKSPLATGTISEPTAELRRELARANTQAFDNWRDACIGVKPADRPPQPVPLFLAIQDYTGEAFIAQLQALESKGRGVLVLRDELAGLIGSLNQYRGGRGGDEQQLLELFDGGGYTSLRVAAGDRSYDRCHVSVYGSIQPAVLRDLVRDGDGNGKWARFLFSALPDRTQKLPLEFSAQEQADMEWAIKRLQQAAADVHKLPPRHYHLSTEARALFAHQEHTYQELAQGASIGAQAAIYGKAAGKVLRVAGILHLLHGGGHDGGRAIDADMLLRASDLVNVLDGWALSFHEAIATGVDQQDALLRRIRQVAQKAAKPISWRQVLQSLSKRQREGVGRAEVEAAMRVLAQTGCGCLQEPDPGPQAGSLLFQLEGQSDDA
jgi:hypothetical protein